MNHPDVKLGKRPPRFDKRTLHMAAYASAMPLVPPRRIDWSLGVNDWRMLKNDVIGCCAISGPAHLEQAWTCNNGNEFHPTDAQVVRDYSAVSGYVPGDDSTDNGCVLLDVMNYWRRVGICGNKIEGYVAVNPLNNDHVKLAIDLYGGLTLGMDLPEIIWDQEVWSVPDEGAVGKARRGSLGGHCVVAVNYGPAGVVIVTWGKLVTVTWDFLRTYTDEAYCALSPQWVSQTKASPGLVDYVTLQADLKAIGA